MIPIPASCANRPVVGGLVAPEHVVDEAVLARLAAKSREEGDCLVWTGSRNPKGYGHIRVRKKVNTTHRAAWIARYGQPPADRPHVLHRCDNPPCWKDGHLFVGTNADNVADRMAKGRTYQSKITHCPQGHPYDEANTYQVNGSGRMCRICMQARREAARLANRKPQVPKTHCPAGHEFSGENLHVTTGGTKTCRKCGRDRARQKRAELKKAGQLGINAQRKIALGAALDQGTASPAQLREASQLSLAGVHKVLGRLCQRGLVVKLCHGLYQSAPGISARDVITSEMGDV